MTLVKDLLALPGEEMNHSIPKAQPLVYHGLQSSPPGLNGTHHHIHIVLLVAFQSSHKRGGSKVDHHSVDPCSAVAELFSAGHHFLVKALASPHDGTEDGNVLSPVDAGDTVQDLTLGKGGDGAIALQAMLLAHFRIEQS